MELNLDGRVAIVTGGARGIGRGIVSRLAACGASVIIVGRGSETQLAELCDKLEAEYGRKFFFLSGDVSNSETANAAVKIAFKEFKRLDIMVNNAGILMDGLIGMISEESIDSTLSVNVKGVINFTQASARLMDRSGGGSIINISSIMGRVGNSGQLVYSASKAAVLGLTKSASKELAAKAIRVNAVAPGYINTDFVKELDSDVDETRRQSIGMGRIGEVEDVADVVLFLASDLSSYVTGQTIGVDGAMLV